MFLSKTTPPKKKTQIETQQITRIPHVFCVLGFVQWWCLMILYFVLLYHGKLLQTTIWDNMFLPFCKHRGCFVVTSGFGGGLPP